MTTRYADICRVATEVGEEKSRIIDMWTNNFLPIEVRLFAYQLFNNSLPVGATMGNRYVINNNVDTNCPFCTVPGFNLPLRETFGHLFFECPATKIVYEQFKARYWNEVDSNDLKKIIFLGLKDGKKNKSQ